MSGWSTADIPDQSGKTYIVTGAKFAGIEADIPAPVRAYVDNLWQRPAFQRAAAVK